MTRTAIVAALHDELASVLALMPDEHKQVIGGRECWVGHLHGQDVVAVLSGIGKVAAATTATLLIQHFGVDRIVFTGVAGALRPGVKVGDVVLARSFLQHDMDAS
ncbi:MAG: 5'-methylthioadenosine/adenosylhomocysteine nucleosidase, partial [Comamonadaceae bacterium]|nr:5'-methylthioadenosine/adenosylhomocysteine nucleosidase [Comamonadaceae bacterium]